VLGTKKKLGFLIELTFELKKRTIILKKKKC
jgi:hypothetical protein